MVHPLLPQPPIPIPICRHLQAISPCCTEVLLSSQSRTRHWGLGDHQHLPVVSSIQDQLAFDDCINRTALLAEATVDAFRHVDIISRRPSAAIFPLLCLDCDGLCRTDRFAQFACNASLLSRRISSKSVLASEARGYGALFVGIVDGIPSEYQVVVSWRSRCNKLTAVGRIARVRRTSPETFQSTRSSCLPCLLRLRPRRNAVAVAT